MSDWTISETEAGGLLLPTTTPSGPHVVVLGRRQRAYLANVVLALPEVKAAIQQAVRQRESALTSRCEAAIEAVIASPQAEIAKARAGSVEGLDRLCGLLEELLTREPGDTVVNVAAPNVTVEAPEKKPTIKEIRRDKFGQIEDVVERPLVPADLER